MARQSLLRNLSAKPSKLHPIRVAARLPSQTTRSFRWSRTVKAAVKEPEPSAAHKARAATGPFSWTAFALFLATGGGLTWYFRNEKLKIEAKKKQELSSQKVGRPKIGGPFALVNQDGRPFTDRDLLGAFSLFGFTNCPDICPEELDKMGWIVDQIKRDLPSEEIKPVFVTCDPARDSTKAIKTYLKDFHPSTIGLTGSYESIKAACKAYRVYFSTPPNAKPTDDYLVDHSIFFYLMDPEGQFIDAFGRSVGKDDVRAKIENYIKEYRQQKA